MKYLIYTDEKIGAEHVDIFSIQISHSVRAQNLSMEMGPVKIVSAGTVKLGASLDEFDVIPGSHTLGIDASDCDAEADATAIKHGLTFF